MAIPGHPKSTSYRTIAWKDYEVLMCGAQEGCPKGLGWRAHWYGRVDRAGMIHWKQADKRASRRGMRSFLKLLAMVFHREWWTEPRWRKLYLTNTWAWREAKRQYHFLIRASWSLSDRKESFERSRAANRRKSIRYSDRNVYKWWLDAGLVGRGKVQYPSHEDAP